MDLFSGSEKMRRFFISPEQLGAKAEPGHRVDLTGEEFHHLKNVTRLEPGERVELLDGEGRLALAEIKSIGKKLATLEVLEIKDLPPLPKPYIRLAVCLPKFQTMDLIVQKAAELGVKEIVLLLSERSFMKKNSEVLTDKITRWKKISLEACKQSGRSWPMEIPAINTLQNFLENTDLKSAVFLFEGESVQDIKSELVNFNRQTEWVTVIIGAEGGFSPDEVSSLQTKGLKPITLGDLVLRVETACITIVSVIKYHFDLMR